MHQSVLDYIQNIPFSRICGRDVLEVGSRDVNGNITSIIYEKQPQNYVRTDMAFGDNVSIVVDALDLVETFGKESWDVIITTETLEHIKDWKTALTEMKKVLRPSGLLVITTRSPGFPQHDYPEDYHRFTKTDMECILGDMILLSLENDPQSPGVFVTGYKPSCFELKDNTDYNVHMIGGE